MDVVNCRTCGRLFNHLGGPRLCPECVRAQEEKFQSVKAYLDEHHSAGIDEVSRETDVSTKQIKQWIREERLFISNPELAGIECENCGKLIATGRFCDNCKNSMANNLIDAFAKPAPAPEPPKKDRDGNRMRFLQT